jgi:ABC-type glycerol-3-phosphate transport system permease component/ABC-type sugar transport system permease subunit
LSTPEKSTGMRTFAGWAILALPLLLVILIFINPVIHTLVLSFQEWKLMGTPQFVGLTNYINIFQDESFKVALKNTFGSPDFYLRVLLLSAGPLALTLLFMELRSGARVAVQVLLALLILFSGAIVTSSTYMIYFSPQGGLAQLLTPAHEDGPIYFFANPEHAVAILSQLFLATGLAWALPFGTALFTSTARGVRSLAPGDGVSYGRFWTRVWKMVVVFVIGAVGFSLAGLEGSFGFPLAMGKDINLITYNFRFSLQMFQPGLGAAAIQFLVIPLLLLGLVVALLLENRHSEISIRFEARSKEKITAGMPAGTGRTIALIVAGAIVAIMAVVLVVIVVLPWIGAVIGLAEPGAVRTEGPGGSFGGSLLLSIVVAVISALLCWAISAATGYSFGWLRPRGSRWLTVLIGMFIFIGPAMFLLPYFLSFRDFRLLDTVASLILPGLLSPAGVLLFTWFFRGARDQKTELEASGASGKNASARVWKSFALFSIPMFAIFMIASLNATLLQITMISNQRLSTAAMFLLRGRNAYMSPEIGAQARLAVLSTLQYLLPIALLIMSAIVVLPRLALIIRKEGEAAPGLDPEDVAKLKG